MNKRRRLLMSQAVQSTPVTTDNYVAGDIAFYDSTDDKIVLVHNEDIDTTTYPTDRYTPIGVVVIPNSHDVYGDGSCGVMSLVEMDWNTPDTGGVSTNGLLFGHYGNDIQGLSNLNKIPIIGNGTSVGDTDSKIIASQSKAALPSDGFTTVQCPHDTDVYYESDTNYQSPSPYFTDNRRNPAYYQTTSPSSTSNCLADFDGKSNSKILQNLATAQSGWKTDYIITNSSMSNYLPAVCCCWRYHADGTQQGDWYLPAMGELGYIMPSVDRINSAITNLQNIYEVTAYTNLRSTNHLSSSNYSTVSVRILRISDGLVLSGMKNSVSATRAFIRIKPDGTITSRTTTS